MKTNADAAVTERERVRRNSKHNGASITACWSLAGTRAAKQKERERERERESESEGERGMVRERERE